MTCIFFVHKQPQWRRGDRESEGCGMHVAPPPGRGGGAEGGGWLLWRRSLSLFSPFWRSARRRSWWAPRSLGSEGGTRGEASILGKSELVGTGPRKDGKEASGTFCCRACSRESFFICSFLKLAVSAVPSELAFARTCAISSLALREAQRQIHHEHSKGKYFVCRTPHFLSATTTTTTTYLSSFSSAWTFSVWYRCSSCLTLARYSWAHFFNTSSFWAIQNRERQTEHKQIQRWVEFMNMLPDWEIE